MSPIRPHRTLSMPRRLSVVALALSLVVVPAIHAKESHPMNSPTLPATASQAMQGMLELIRHTPSVAALTPEAMGEYLGLPITRVSADHFGYAQPLPEGWTFSIQRQQIGKDGPRVDLTFAPAGTARLSPASICEPDFAAFTEELERMGFARQHLPGPRGHGSYDAFTRGGGQQKEQRVVVYPMTDRDASGAVTRTCVKMVLVS